MDHFLSGLDGDNSASSASWLFKNSLTETTQEFNIGTNSYQLIPLTTSNEIRSNTKISTSATNNSQTNTTMDKLLSEINVNAQKAVSGECQLIPITNNKNSDHSTTSTNQILNSSNVSSNQILNSTNQILNSSNVSSNALPNDMSSSLNPIPSQPNNIISNQFPKSLLPSSNLKPSKNGNNFTVEDFLRCLNAMQNGSTISNVQPPQSKNMHSATKTFYPIAANDNSAIDAATVKSTADMGNSELLSAVKAESAISENSTPKVNSLKSENSLSFTAQPNSSATTGQNSAATTGQNSSNVSVTTVLSNFLQNSILKFPGNVTATLQKDGVVKSEIQSENGHSIDLNSILANALKNGSPVKDSEDAAGNVVANSQLKWNMKRMCNICGKILSRGDKLKNHMRIHTNNFPYHCPICGHGFIRSEGLKVHIRIHTGERPFKCACGKSYTRKDKLTRHAIVHTGERPFACASCDKTFTRKDKLQRHELIHRAEKPFSCVPCNLVFIRHEGFSAHMEKKHPERLPYTLIPPNLNLSALAGNMSNTPADVLNNLGRVSNQNLQNNQADGEVEMGTNEIRDENMVLGEERDEQNSSPASSCPSPDNILSGTGISGLNHPSLQSIYAKNLNYPNFHTGDGKETRNIDDVNKFLNVQLEEEESVSTHFLSSQNPINPHFLSSQNSINPHFLSSQNTINIPNKNLDGTSSSTGSSAKDNPSTKREFLDTLGAYKNLQTKNLTDYFEKLHAAKLLACKLKDSESNSASEKLENVGNFFTSNETIPTTTESFSAKSKVIIGCNKYTGNSLTNALPTTTVKTISTTAPAETFIPTNTEVLPTNSKVISGWNAYSGNSTPSILGFRTSNTTFSAIEYSANNGNFENSTIQDILKSQGVELENLNGANASS